MRRMIYEAVKDFRCHNGCKQGCNETGYIRSIYRCGCRLLEVEPEFDANGVDDPGLG